MKRNPSRSTLKIHLGARHGIALVLVLSMIALITILVVGFTVNMRTERQAAHSLSENARAKLVADAALSHAISLLAANIPQPVPPVPVGAAAPSPTNWSISPGMLNLVTGLNNVTRIPLSTNPSAEYSSSSSDANLNLLQAASNSYPILGTSQPMCVAWVPLMANPGQAASKNNALAARYAFWIDDENAKININTAYGKPAGMDYSKLTPTPLISETSTEPTSQTNVFPLGHPASVNLDIFGAGIDRTKLLNRLKTKGVALSPDLIKIAVTGTDPAAFYEANKFSLTAANRDPEFNVFGKSRIFMYGGPTGQLDTAPGGGMFQRFRDLDAPMYFHGNENHDPAAYPGGNPYQDYSAMYYTAASLSSIFYRKDWPGMPAASFVNKWDTDPSGSFSGLQPEEMGKREADQVAWNIVTMGALSDFNAYTAATPGAAVTLGNHLTGDKTGSTGSVNYPNAAVAVGSLSGKAIVPAVPRPMVDEICLMILPEVHNGKNYLQFRVNYGVWLPPGYPATDFSKDSCDLFVGLTHLDYTVAQGGVTKSTQTDSKYLNDNAAGVKKLQAADVADTMQPGQRIQVLAIRDPSSPLTPQFYASNGTTNGFRTSYNGAVGFAGGVVNITVRMRLYVRSIMHTQVADPQSPPSQLIPVWDTHDPGTTAPTSFSPPAPNLSPNSRVYKTFWPPAEDHPAFSSTAGDCVEFKFDLDLDALTGVHCTRSLRVADPRTGGLARVWKPSWKDSTGNDLAGVATMANVDSVGAAHNTETDTAISAGWDINKFAYVDMAAPPANTLPHPSIGLFSSVATGMQRGIPGATFKLQPNANSAQLPDWLLLDLIAPTVSPPSGSTSWADIVKMNATAGKINVNAGIYPSGGSFTPPTRILPLQALFANTPAGSGVAQNIVDHKLAVGGSAYAGGKKFYNYPGEVCEIAGVADSTSPDWIREATIRNLASAITTKSNTFSVWGVAQTIRKLASHTQYDKYEVGDAITGEKRFQAIVERYIWSGLDGVAGNGHTDTGGKYDLVTQNTQQPGYAPQPTSNIPYKWEVLDGPDAPTYPTSEFADPSINPYNQKVVTDSTSYTNTPIDTANNPVRAVMKYRVIYFRYLD